MMRFKHLFPLSLSFFCRSSRGMLPSYTVESKDSTGYTPDPATEYLVTQYADATGVQGTFYAITNDTTLIIIDGGWADNAAAVREVIAAHGNHVNAWILSHPHQDHAGAFNQIYASPDGITIDAVYDNGFDYDFIEADESRTMTLQ